MILRVWIAAFICLVFSACAHIPIERTTAVQAQSSFVLIQHVEVYDVNCSPEYKGCALGKIRLPSGVGSGGVVGYKGSSTYVLTAKHVVSSFGDMSLLSEPILRQLVHVYASRSGLAPRSVYELFVQEKISFKPRKSEFYAMFSIGSPLLIESTDCDTDNDICLVSVPHLVDVSTISVSKVPPYAGQTVRCAAAPFGSALPTLFAVPIFEGIFSGYDIRTKDHPVYAWYTMQSSPGSSGALILNKEGELIGVVVGMSMGKFCGHQGCFPMRSGITAAVPHSVIVEFLNERLN